MKVFKPHDVRLAATGSYFPARVVTNADLVAMGAPLAADEIERTTGIRERRWVAEGEATSDMATAAARQALARAGTSPGQVERLVLATVSPDHPTPAAACLVHAKLGLGTCPAMDLTAACSGFLYALDTAARAVATGDAPVLAVAADVRSRYLDVTDRATCALFGDGAGAAVVTRGEPNLLAVTTVADGTGAHSIYVPAGGSAEPASAASVAAGRHRLHMADGAQVYLAAVEGMLAVAKGLLDACDLSFADVQWLIPHQANMHILKRVAWKAKVPFERVAVNLPETGNTSGATVPTALDALLRSGNVRPGDRLLLVAAGAGHTGGAALLVADEALLRVYR